LSFGGKVEGKLVMPFGSTAAAHKTLSAAQPGQVYDINVVKNEKGYNDWTSATLSTGAPSASPPAYEGARNVPAPSSPARTSTYETPEERAKKQVYIIRQSSLSAAIGTLSPGAKSALKPQDVIALAQEYTDFVLGTGAVTQDTSGFEDMHDDVPI